MLFNKFINEKSIICEKIIIFEMIYINIFYPII